MSRESNAFGSVSANSPVVPDVTSPSTILVVDDDSDNRALLEAELQRDGYLILTAQDGEEGVEQALSALPDLILMDLAMPRLDGFGAIEQLLKHDTTRMIPIIIMSAMVEVTHRVRGLKLGAIDYICKPFDLQDLQDRVRTHLRLQHLERLRRQQQHEKVALEVLGAAAHELAQPLSGALGQVQLLQLLATRSASGELELTRGRFQQIEQCLQRAEDVLKKLAGLDSYSCLDYAGGEKIIDIHQDGDRP
jgi:DNA-binding response OmpR family regulator